MNEELIIKELSEKLGVAADKIWQTLIYQAQIEAAYNWLWFGLLATTTFYLGKYFYKQYQAESDDKTSWLIIGGIVTILPIFGALECLWDAIKLTLNPEYWALKQLVK